MTRRGKLKYKDVVKSQNPSKIHPKKQRRKLNKLSNGDIKNKRKRKNYNHYVHEKDEVKKPKILQRQEDSDLDSFSEEDTTVNSLLKTFCNSGHDKREQAVDSSDSSEDETENVLQAGFNCDEEQEDNIEYEENEKHNEDTDISQSEVDVKQLSFTDEEENAEDPFIKHVYYELHDSLLNSLQNTPISVNLHSVCWPELGNIIIQIPKYERETEKQDSVVSILKRRVFADEGTVPKIISRSAKADSLFIKLQIHRNLLKVNEKVNGSENFTDLQRELFSVMNNYQDIYYPHETFRNLDEIRYIYCLHAVNHILKTRLKVLHHNAKLSKKEDVPDEFRDQGVTRPKVLFIVPFKDAAYKIVRMLIDLILPEDKGNVINKKRFLEEYTGNELYLPKKNPKPEDYELTFQGNTSDDFKMGITVTKKSLKLFADFYSSDIIIASPLGLRTVIGAEGESQRDYDFLASIELLIMDQTEIFLMQNWDHIIHVLNHIHLQPKDSHGTDFSRVRIWSLNGWAKYYRQTLIFSSLMLPEINAIFNKKCLNYAGKVKVTKPVEIGTIGQVVVQLPHVFHRFDSQNATECIDARFDFFTNKILSLHKESLMKQTLIFIPSYFDYVRIRNYFKREDIGFVQICEYSKEAKVARARDMFFHGDAHFLLYTERYHFFNRKRIKGIRHLLFYQPPTFPHFYYEMCNFMQEGNQNRRIGSNSNMSVTVIYSKYDIHQLSAVVGTEKAAKMIQSERKVHMMVTGSD